MDPMADMQICCKQDAADWRSKAMSHNNKQFGYYWELYHVLTNEVVHSGFEKDDSHVPQRGDWKCKVAGFAYRFTPLYEAAATQTIS